MVEAFPACTRVIGTPSPVSLAAATTETVAHIIEWPQDGYVFGMSATTQGDGSALGLSSIGIRVSVADNNEEIFTDGTGATFIAIGALVGLLDFDPLPMCRRVYKSQKWLVLYKNFHGATAFTPSSCWYFLADRDRKEQDTPPPHHPEFRDIMPYPGITRAVKVPNLAALVGVGFGTGQLVEFQHSGEVVWMNAISLADGSAAGAASLACSVRIGDNNEELFNDGGGAAQLPLALVFGSNGNYLLPLRRRVYAHQKWNVTPRNFGAGTFTPEIVFGVVDDKLIQTMSGEDPVG